MICQWQDWDKGHLVAELVYIKITKCLVGTLSPVSNRCVYSGLAEVSIYVATIARGKGIGEMLLNELIKQSESNEIWTLQFGYLTENICTIK
jgi:phosphinothricin acetyltransferase